jgi:hypothetical protein
MYRNDVQAVAEDLQLKKRKEITQWLWPEDFSVRHEELRKACAENTGEWFLESSEFKNWIIGNGPSCLLCVGIGVKPHSLFSNTVAGAGKSTLM